MGWHFGPQAHPTILRGAQTCLILDGYGGDDELPMFRAAILAFLAAPFAVLEAAQEHVFHYYEDMKRYLQGEEGFPRIEAPAEVWKHVRFGGETSFHRRHDGDRAVYVSLECNCDWEVEHGLQIVLRHGDEVCKVGPYDGHLTNENAFADPALEGVIYRRL
jgi:hypothetical protein